VTAYWLSRANVSDPDKFRPYRESVPGIIAKYGGIYLARGSAEALEGTPCFDRYFVIAFPSHNDAIKCFRSEEYQAIAALRASAGEVEIVVVDGDVAGDQ
jgi:uncharacterized protein (DUF1330 family)